MDRQQLLEDAHDIFIYNDMKGNMLHSFFKQCMNYEHGLQPKDFYIDKRVPFKRSKRLMTLVDSLQTLGPAS